MSSSIRFSVYRRQSSPNFYIELYHPAEGRQEFSLRTKNKREADRKAGAILRDIEEGRWTKKHRTEWNKFKDEYLDAESRSLAKSSVDDIKGTLTKLEDICKPQTVQQLNADMIREFTAGLPRKMAKRTVAKHLRNLKKLLRRAERLGMIPKVPHVQMPKGASRPKAKGRAITAEELDRMLVKAADVVGTKAAPSFQQLLRGLFFGGLRLSEALNLSWDQNTGAIAVDLYRRRPMFLIPTETDKRGSLPSLPNSWECWKLFLRKSGTEESSVLSLSGTGQSYFALTL